MRTTLRLIYHIIKAGYREGITAGKESALQSSFDEGFAETGAPLGRQLGYLRGLVNGVLAYLESTHYPTSSTPEENNVTLVNDTLGISEQLSRMQFAALVPLDEEAFKHAREHGDVRDYSEEAERRRNVALELDQSRQRLKVILEKLGLGHLDFAEPTVV